MRLCAAVGPVQWFATMLNTPTELREHQTRLAQSLARGQELRAEGLGTDRFPIELDALTFRYRAADPDVLTDVTLRIPQGLLVVLIGPHRSGKATLLKLIGQVHQKK